MVESQGKVSEKSGKFEMDIEWQPCKAPFTILSTSWFTYLVPGRVA